MKVRCVSKLICLLTFVVTSSFCLSACSSEETPSIQILAAGSSVFPESFDSEATEWISNYTDGEETSVEIRSMYLGEGEKIYMAVQMWQKFLRWLLEKKSI